jgi:hypothetical protein
VANDWLTEEGQRLGCGQLHLDSGVGPERFDAHRLYHNHGLAIYSHHFARAVEVTARHSSAPVTWRGFFGQNTLGMSVRTTGKD